MLRALGASGALLPVLPSQLARGATPPKRLVVVAWNNGFVMEDLWPRGGETDFTLGATLSPLERFRSHMLFVGGVGLKVQLDANPDYPGHHHAYVSLLTGVPLTAYSHSGFGYARSGGPSVDQYIAQHLARRVSLRFPSLVLSAQWSEGTGPTRSNLSYAGPGEGITPEKDPVRVYEALFASRLVPRARLRRTVTEKRSVLDFVGRALSGYATALGGQEKEQIQAHLESVRVTERRLGLLSTDLQCGLPPRPPPLPPTGGKAERHEVLTYPPLIKAHMDLIHVAFRCDLTRVATLVLTDAGGDNLIYPWLGDEFLRKGDERKVREFHDITHTQDNSEQNRRDKIRVDTWYVEQTAYLAGLLAGTPEGNASMLDHTALVVTNGMGHNHNSNTVPYVVVGSCGRYFKTGRFLKCGSAVGVEGPPERSRRGAPHNGLLVALANAMGVDGSRFGVPEHARELPGLRG